MTGKESKEKKKLISIVNICICISVIGILMCGSYYAYYYVQQNNKVQEYEELRVNVQKMDITEENTKAPNNVPDKTLNTITIMEENPIDFEKVWEQNVDVYAWIQVAGTVIDYPVLQHPTDNTYYLNYNIDGTKGYPGCIYSESYNKKDFSDFNTVLYGHNMKNGSMFAELHHFKDTDFFDKNKEITIYTPDKKYVYDIFAAYTYDDRHILSSFNFENEKICTDYIEQIFNRKELSANFRNQEKITNKSKILTLSTCIKGKDDKRFLVQAVLINEIETK